MIETVTPPVVDADFTALVLDHLKIEAGDEEAAYTGLIDSYIEAAIGRVEATSGRMLFKRTLKLTADAFGTALVLPASPVSAVSAVTYVDTAGAIQTLPSAAYALVDKAETPTLYPAYGYEWPATRSFPGVVTVTFDAGYGADMEDIPAPLRMAVMQTVTDWFRFAGNVATAALNELPDSAYRACQRFRRTWQ